MKNNYLSEREMNVMQVLWKYEKPMTVTEIVESEKELTTPTCLLYTSLCRSNFIWRIEKEDLRMIEVKNLTKTYKTGNKALKGINIQIQDGEFVFIMGRSGSGKSTLLKLLLKELEPTSGQIIVNDMDLEKMPSCLLYTSRCV